MDEMTQQNAALVEQAAAAAESMQSQAQQLTGQVSTFTLDDRDVIGGATKTAAAISHPAKKVDRPVAVKSINKTPLLKRNEPAADEWEEF